MSHEYQATLHACGEDFPPALGDRWEFQGWAILDGETGPFLLARWRREVCHWCGSRLGTTTEHDIGDGWPRCLNCGGS